MVVPSRAGATFFGDQMSKNPFVYTDKTIPLTVLNAKARQLNSERRAEMDVAHDQVQKAVKAAFGKSKELKPVVPQASGHAKQLKAEAAKAAAAKANENKPASK
jgi:hypothetical protein